jgi:hypothetical protein
VLIDETIIISDSHESGVNPLKPFVQTSGAAPLKGGHI